ncbi:2,3-diaminopropionate biosynthesis protein SbnA [Paenibacillus sp. GSMTC-2017]|uniref:2,3-diaminopropionate biosynthesis protein SbnA n=1 Tax=Paenibacillus sp. GSMTC-2017 TaxID=2794350 RepID=UPI0018D778A9|nr:2,3-diaminopropionate biosynthesis protein SbnA [Paenibacillus sp. GSMTC-2017]MBH5318644.1 2,3-diaminopropionate biosynthesis protein SbnA [Paenibacillus sp. GSMTC-2017]
MNKGWLKQIGNTPLVPLSKLFENARGIQVYGKLEMMNPSGSSKDRPALRILQKAYEQGEIGPGSIIIESSSGNMAISLAAICSYMGMKFISVIDPRTASQNIAIMKAYGADVSYVNSPDPATGEFLPARLERVRQLTASLPNSFWPNQYGNEHNYMAHYDGTMPEIANALDKIDYIVGGVSTCGTMLGCARYIHDHNLETKVVAVDAVGSVILGGDKGPRRFPGLGAGIVPPFGQNRFMDFAVNVSDWDMVTTCLELAEKESILAGPSTGAVIAALKSMVDNIPDHSTCVVIVHDRGERYMDTVFNHTWVKEQFQNNIPAERG